MSLHTNVYPFGNSKNLVVKKCANSFLANREFELLRRLLSVANIPKAIELVSSNEKSPTGTSPTGTSPTEKTLIVMTRLYGVDLFDHFSNSGDVFTEYETRVLISKLLVILRDIHALGVIHCDVKLENIVYDLDTGRVGLVDFDQKTTPLYASPQYHTPGCESKPYKFTPKDDVWGVGIVAYILLTHNYPFFSTREILSNPVLKIPGISEQANSFIGNCLNKNEDARFSVNEAISHPWLADW